MWFRFVYMYEPLYHDQMTYEVEQYYAIQKFTIFGWKNVVKSEEEEPLKTMYESGINIKEIQSFFKL